MKMGAGSSSQGAGRAGPEVGMCVLAHGPGGGPGRRPGERGKEGEGPHQVFGLCRPAGGGDLPTRESTGKLKAEEERHLPLKRSPW